PALGGLERMAAQALERPALVGAQQPFADTESPRNERARPLAGGGRSGTKLREIEWERADWPVSADDGQRDDRLAGPAGEVVGVERKPAGQENQLWRERRHLFPRPQPEQRHPDVGEHPRRARPAPRAAPSSRP